MPHKYANFIAAFKFQWNIKKKPLEPNSLTTHIWCSGKQMHSPQTGTLCTKQYNLVAWNIQKINKKQINHSSTEQNFKIHQATIKAKTEQDCIEFLRFCFSIFFNTTIKLIH